VVRRHARPSRTAWEPLVRIDVWTDNIELHRYYEKRAFKHVRTLDLADYPSGALFQRPATNWRAEAESTAIAEKPQVPPRHPHPASDLQPSTAGGPVEHSSVPGARMAKEMGESFCRGRALTPDYRGVVHDAA
jgi:hypothetical protein